MIWLILACGMNPPPAPTPPDGNGGGGGGDDSGPCGTCTLTDCADDDVPSVYSEDDCEDAAFSYDCDDWEWEEC